MSAINPASQGLPQTIGFYGEGEYKQFAPNAAVFGVAAHEAENHRVFENTAAAAGEIVAGAGTTFRVAWDPVRHRAVVVGGESHETLIKPTPRGGVNLGGGGVLIDPTTNPNSPQNVQRAAEKKAQAQARVAPRGLDRLRMQGPDKSQLGRLSTMKATIHARLNQIDAELARRKIGVAPDNGIPAAVPAPPPSVGPADAASATAAPAPGDTVGAATTAPAGADAASGGGEPAASAPGDGGAGAGDGPLSRAAAFHRAPAPLSRAAASHRPPPVQRAPVAPHPPLPRVPNTPHPPAGAPVIRPAPDRAAPQAQRPASAPGPSDGQVGALEAQRQLLTQQLQHVDDSLQKMTGELLKRLFGTVTGAIMQTEKQAGATAGIALALNPAVGGGTEDLTAGTGGGMLSGGSDVPLQSGDMAPAPVSTPAAPSLVGIGSGSGIAIPPPTAAPPLAPLPATSAPPLPTPNYTAQGTTASNTADRGLLVNGVA